MLFILPSVLAQESEEYVKGEILVSFKEGVQEGQVVALVSSFNLIIKKSSTLFGDRIATINVPINSESQWINEFEKQEIVKYASLNHVYGLIPVPNECPDNCNCDEIGNVVGCSTTVTPVNPVASTPSSGSGSVGSGGGFGFSGGGGSVDRREKMAEEERYESCDYPIITANSFVYNEEDKIYLKVACNNGGYFIGDDVEIYFINDDYIPPSNSNDLLKAYGIVVADLDDEFYDLLVKIDPSVHPKIFQRSGVYTTYLCEDDCERRYAGPFFKFYKRNDCPSSCSCDENSFYCGLKETEFCTEQDCIRSVRGCICLPSIDVELEKRAKFNNELGNPRKIIYYPNPKSEGIEGIKIPKESGNTFVTPAPGENFAKKCFGCLLGESCVPIGTRNKEEFCNFEYNWVSQKQNEISCDNNYECASNFCSNGLCYDISAELKETRSMLETILQWIKNIFS